MNCVVLGARRLIVDCGQRIAGLNTGVFCSAAGEDVTKQALARVGFEESRLYEPGHGQTVFGFIEEINWLRSTTAEEASHRFWEFLRGQQMRHLNFNCAVQIKPIKIRIIKALFEDRHSR